MSPWTPTIESDTRGVMKGDLKAVANQALAFVQKVVKGADVPLAKSPVISLHESWEDEEKSRELLLRVFVETDVA